MKNVGKKLCVFLLVAVMIVGLLPAAAFATTGDFFDSGPGNTVKDNLMPYLNIMIIDSVKGTLKGAAKFGEVSLIPGNDKALQCEITIYKPDENGSEFLHMIIGEFLEALHDRIEDEPNTSAPTRVKPEKPDPSTCLGGSPSSCLPTNPDSCMSADGTLKLRGLSGKIGDPNDKLYIQDFCNLTGLTQGLKTAHDLKGKGFAIRMWNAPDDDDSPATPGAIDGTCTFVFVEPELAVAEKEKENLTVADGTVTGTDLVDKGKATGATVYDVKRMFEGAVGEAKIQIVDNKKEVIEDTSLPVGTGYKVQLVTDEGTILDEYILVVKGDTSGDGEINSLDVQQICNHIIAGNNADMKLKGVFETAAYMGEDNVLNSLDVQIIENLIADSKP